MRFPSRSFALALLIISVIDLQAQRMTSLVLPADSTASFLNPQQQGWKEDAFKRTIFSSTYHTPDGRIIIHYSEQQLNYNKNGQLVPVVTKPEFSGPDLVASEQPFPVMVSNRGVVTIGDKINSVSYSLNASVQGQPCVSGTLSLTGNQAIIKNIIPGVDKSFSFRYDAVEYDYVLNNPVSTAGSDLVISEELKFPAGATLIPDMQYGHEGKQGWQGAMHIVSGGKELGRMNGVVVTDAANDFCTASYIILNQNGRTTIRIIVPDSWINDPSRKYPVTIDPLVTGPTSTWAGSYIPSCITPASSADSIQVTIPAQVAVSGFFVSGSYYASPFTTAVMSDGNMFFSTSCNVSGGFTVAPPTGSTPGTGYLTAYDLHVPLLCCFPQSCSAQTFYLTMHLQRTAPGTGCNSTYIYHDPFSGFPFSAYIEGHTVESWGPGWNVTPSTICSNLCTITGSVYIKYGVPPYTITHPWMTGSVVTGTPAGCSAGTVNKPLSLTIPGCPLICDTTSTLSIPPPVVVDACGNFLIGLAPKIINLKPTPQVSAAPDPATACSGVPFSVNLSSCVSGSTFSWTGHGISGSTAAISDTVQNSGSAADTTTYSVVATSNGCSSVPYTVTVHTDPLPQASFSYSSPAIINMPVTFADNSASHGGTVNSWIWSFGDNDSAATQNPVHVYQVPGVYHVCLLMATSDGCVDSVCSDVTVIPAQLVLPNVITPNGDNQNDFLYFRYLEFFGSNSLKVFDRWGKSVYEKKNYSNDWNAKGCHDGTYYYILETADGKSYPGYVQVITK